MKKRVASILLALVMLLCLFPASAAAEVERVTVTFDANGGCFYNQPGLTVDTVEARKGDTSTINGSGCGTPTREGYEFVGWYLYADGSGEQYDPWNYTPTYQQDTTFYAKWQVFVPTSTAALAMSTGFMSVVEG